jgi:predicted amidophosphoribosyltransferase
LLGGNLFLNLSLFSIRFINAKNKTVYMKCKGCSSEPGELDHYCRKCGSDLENPYCSECNSIIKKDDTFCWKCGASLEKDEKE